MSAKILAFDPTRRVPPRRYVPLAMRGRLLQMPHRRAEITSGYGTGVKASAQSFQSALAELQTFCKSR